MQVTQDTLMQHLDAIIHDANTVKLAKGSASQQVAQHIKRSQQTVR
jgi:hypothetical protein